MKSQQRRPLGRPRANEKQQSTRELILKTAAKIFLDRGYSMVSVDEIADECNVTKATVYYYFSTKAQLFTNAMIEMMERIHARIQSILSEDKPLREKLLIVTEAHLKATFHIDLRGFMQGTKDTLSAEQILQTRQAEERMHKEIETAFREAIDRREIPAIHPAFAAHAYLSLLQIGNYRDKNNAPLFSTVEETSRQIVHFFWCGLSSLNMDTGSGIGLPKK